MKEIEIKILEVNREEVEKKIIELGGKKVSDKKLFAILYDPVGGSFKKSKELLRLRSDGEKHVLTYKKKIKKEGLKIFDEYEVKVSDFETTKKILENLGFAPRITATKRRITYVLDGVHFEFDKHLEELDFIPEFLEIEADSEEKLFEYVEKIGFKKGDCTSLVFTEIIEYYKKNHNILKSTHIL